MSPIAISASPRASSAATAAGDTLAVTSSAAGGLTAALWGSGVRPGGVSACTGAGDGNCGCGGTKEDSSDCDPPTAEGTSVGDAADANGPPPATSIGAAC